MSSRGTGSTCLLLFSFCLGAARADPFPSGLASAGSVSTTIPAPPGGRVETEEREGSLLARRVYDASEALVEEATYDGGGLSELRSYRRTAGRLTRIEARNGSGDLVGSLDYRYDGRGRLVAIIPSGSLGSGARA